MGGDAVRGASGRGGEGTFGGAVGLAAALSALLVAVAALLLTMAPAEPGAGSSAATPAGGPSSCAQDPSGALFGLICEN
ncbi:hypothetical protein AD006_20750 [Pseudonocardia sp. EC080610-09]|uniref:hypothetical protein n=1 Tax=Pseudonocardia sp. EC080619-01 TaxID=1096856 RepID=UPI0006CB5955|nr:hypothetical protein [Pseudonocardia sp. EC080619-01]ALE73744.1 hypothetical protein FRP1_13070 [Pseudonocardia sp. EC080625-04]ALL77132.1 hypothetical protein AD006_20750 [Pseudonocardia sp. EC080610-09]ALL80046.1 hypothetical protein AD017_00330 [Pseudonocardia sp. EC080619-01]